MKAAAVLLLLMGLAACADPDRDWAKACIANGFKEAVCTCVAEKVPAKQREILSYMTGPKFGGGWVASPAEEPAAACARHVAEARAAKP